LKLAEALSQPTTENAKTQVTDENAIAKRSERDLPTFEEYEALKTGRNPYFCVSCEKNFTRTSIK
jgi:hypothetical protein